MAHRARKRREPTTAFHTQADMSDSSFNVVGFGNLRVFIVKDEDMWFAQCLDINYAAQGKSLARVKRNFEEGLTATVDEHLHRKGHIEDLLTHGPSPRMRRELLRLTPQAMHYSQVTVHKLPKQLQDLIRYQGIEFIQPAA